MDRRKFIKSTGWSVMGLAMSGTLLSACNPKNREKTKAAAKIDPNGLKVFWGDIHNHCNITYGHGDMRLAFEAAKSPVKTTLDWLGLSIITSEPSNASGKEDMKNI